MILGQEKTIDSNVIKIGIASTEEEKQAIYHLRYHIYAEEIAFKLVTVDHINRLLYDDLDEWCTLFYAKVDSQMVGTVRVNIGQFNDFPPDIAEAFHMDRFQKFYKKNELRPFAFASKGMVHSAFRRLPVFTNLMSKVFELYCNEKIHFAFGNSNFHLLPLHEHYGHRRIGKNIVEPNLGLMASFVMMPDDMNHLQAVRSPFLEIARNKRKVQNNQLVDWFHSEFPEVETIINSQLVNKESFWDSLCTRLGNLPHKTMSVLKGLNEIEAQKFLHRCGVIIQCSKGDYILSNLDASQELNILLKGTLSSASPGSAGIRPGQHFGGNGLVERSRHMSSIVAETNAEILVLSYHFFLKFRREFPHIAYKIIANLK